MVSKSGAINLTENTYKMVQAYRVFKTFRAAGNHLQVSGQRIEQAVKLYEKITGDKLPRSPKGGPRTGLVEWICSVCGEKRMLVPSKAILRKRCLSCFHKSFRKDDLGAQIVAARCFGHTFYSVTVNVLGRAPNRTGDVQYTAYKYLMRQNPVNYNLINDLWPNGVPNHILNRVAREAKRVKREQNVTSNR